MAAPRSGSTTMCGLVRPPGTPPSTSSMMASGSSLRGLSDVRNGQIAQVRRRRAHQGTLGPVAVPATAEDAEHPARRRQRPRLAEHDLQAGRRVGVVDEHREGRASSAPAGPASRRGDDLEPARDRSQVGHGPCDLPGPSPGSSRAKRGLGRQERVVDVDGTGQRRDDALPAPGELRAARTQHDVGGIGVVHGDGRDAGALQETLAPRVVGVDDAAQRVARGEERRLRLEVLLHRPVVVEVVVAEVGEDRDVEVDALDP